MSYISEQRRRYQREWHQANKKRRLAAAKLRREAIHVWFKDYKSKLSCEQCGFDHPAALDFHHKDESEKRMEISKMITEKLGKETIMEEIAKCQVLCSNCHRIFHFEASGGVV